MNQIINFNNKYDRNEFIPFLQHFLPNSFQIKNESIELNFKSEKIKKVNMIGIVDELDLPIYEIHHDSENDPRVGLSRDSFRLIASYGYSSAICNFVSASSPNYRFSFIDIIPEVKKGKVIIQYSNPRRYSYFLGPDAKVHTPTEYLTKKIPITDKDEIKEKFSIEVVNKEFYNNIARLFTELAGGKRKEGTKEIDGKEGVLKIQGTEDHALKQRFAVRLIGRIVFCWFLKKKDIIPDKILSKDNVKNYSKCYHELIEPLFFQVLNIPQEHRHDNIKKSKLNVIPFLNGGLFEPHLEDDYNPDSFTSLSMNGPKIPNDWFEDLFDLLDIYNFTVDENTPVDIDLSIDPEMLGRIFENLLAEINPETGETARKQSGSYYTPRMIVEYMVDESIKQYLVNNSNIKEEIINNILDYDVPSVKLTNKEREEIVHVLHTCKIIDPACGSGAFPMGILHKILLALSKVDPDSNLWLQKKLEGIKDSILRKEIKRNLTQKNFEYVHKLGIIHNCIYGVDIKPIDV